MTRKEEICDVTKEQFTYVKDENLKSALRFAFIDGAKWADEHPNLESLWHDASEEPQDKEEYILYNSEYNNNWFINSLEYILECCYNSWCEVVEKENIKQWAYVKDVFPKGGEK